MTSWAKTAKTLGIIVALVAALLISTGSSPSPAAAMNGVSLVTTNANYSAGWVVRNENGQDTKQWVSSTCRQQLEGAGHVFDPVGWGGFGSLPPATANLDCAAIAALLGGPVDPGPDGSGRLVTSSANYPHGWVLVVSNGAETKQWLSSTCRQQLQGAGNTFAITSYTDFGRLSPASPPLSCNEIQQLLDGGGNPGSGQFTVSNGQVLDPTGAPFEIVGLNTFGGAMLWTDWDSNIINDKDVYLNEWQINTIRLNITCDENCDGTLDEVVNELGTNVEWVGAGGPEGWALFDYQGTRYKIYLDGDCRADQERLMGTVFTTVDWQTVVQPVTLWPQQSTVTCSAYLDVDEVVQAYAGTDTVIIIESHGLYFPQPPTAAQVQEKVDYFTQIANQYKDNPYVWFSLYNEPLNECNLGAHGTGLIDDNGDPLTTPGVASRTWVDIQVPVIDAIRATGAKNLIVSGTSNYGQDRCDASGGFNYNQSALLAYGDEILAADPEHNVLFDMHVYSRWANSSFNDLDAYFTALRNAGLTVMVGEIGGACANNLYRTDLRAAQVMYDAYDQLANPPVGMVAWSAATGYFLTDADWKDASRVGPNNELFDATQHLNNLTEAGKMFYDFARGTNISNNLTLCP